MRPSSDSQNRIRRAPKKFAAMTPVRKQDAEAQQHAEARDVQAEQAVGPRDFRKEQQRLVERRHQEMQHPERDAERHPDEQAGDEIALHRDASSRDELDGDVLVLDAAGAAGFRLGRASALRLGSSLRPWFRPSPRRPPARPSCRRPCPLSWRPPAAAAEVGHVPAAALELEAGRGDELLQRALAASGAGDERRVARASAALRPRAGMPCSGIRRSA